MRWHEPNFEADIQVYCARGEHAAYQIANYSGTGTFLASHSKYYFISPKGETKHFMQLDTHSDFVFVSLEEAKRACETYDRAWPLR